MAIEVCDTRGPVMEVKFFFEIVRSSTRLRLAQRRMDVQWMLAAGMVAMMTAAFVSRTVTQRIRTRTRRHRSVHAKTPRLH
jgi:hypothetical protein